MNDVSNRAGNPWPTWVRWLVLAVGLTASAAVGYVTALAVTITAVIFHAAPLLVGDSTQQQPWVTPVAVGAGLFVFGLGVRLSVAVFRRRRKPAARAPAAP